LMIPLLVLDINEYLNMLMGLVRILRKTY
jgi:hypothetical protein